MDKIYFASTNHGKLGQFQFVADSLGCKVSVVSAYKEFDGIEPYSEDFNTMFEIVEHGCREVFRQVKKPIVVEDSILEVAHLDGGPGLTASEYLKEHGREGLIKELEGAKDRSAKITSLVGYYAGDVLHMFKTVVEGSIAETESYKEGEPAWIGPTEIKVGGGFNSAFIIKGDTRTLADITAEESIKLGYREPNFQALLEMLGYC